MYPLKLEYAQRLNQMMNKAKIINPHEDSRDHPDAYFKVYEITDKCYRLELKVKCNRDGNFLHILRVYEKIKRLFRRLPRVSTPKRTKGNLNYRFTVANIQ